MSDRPKKRNTGLIVGLVLGGAGLVVLLIVGTCVGVFYFGGKAVDKAEQQKAAATKLPTRDQFREKVMAKNADEVIAAVGKPKTTSENGNLSMWYYEDCSIDPITGRTDSWVQIVFTDGLVSGVNF